VPACAPVQWLRAVQEIRLAYMVRSKVFFQLKS
jgi:hypothetical protein